MIEDLDLKQNIITKHSMTIIMKKGRKDKINLSIPSVKTIIKQADISQLNKYITIRTKNVIPNFPILLNTYPTVEYPFSTGEVYLSHSSNDKNYIALYTYNTNNSIKNKTYFIYADNHDTLPSHTFLVFYKNNKVYWFEHSWYDMKGIHEYNNIKALLNDVKNKFIDSRKNEINSNFKGF